MKRFLWGPIILIKTNFRLTPEKIYYRIFRITSSKQSITSQKTYFFSFFFSWSNYIIEISQSIYRFKWIFYFLKENSNFSIFKRCGLAWDSLNLSKKASKTFIKAVGISDFVNLMLFMGSNVPKTKKTKDLREEIL